MRFVSLPATDLSLSVVGMGCWTIGGAHWGPDQDDARAARTVHAALDVGINWFDTAPIYGDGHADRVLAAALHGRPDALIATKVGAVPGPDGHVQSNLCARTIRTDAVNSLRRLRRDRIDLLQVHWPCESDTPLEETIDALERLKSDGLIRHWGLCNYDAKTLARARELGPVASLQTPLSLLRREFEQGLDGECQRLRAHGQSPPSTLGVLVYETLCRGLLTKKNVRTRRFPASDMRAHDPRFQGARFAHARALTLDLSRAAERVGSSTAAIATGWTLSRASVSAAIVGARSPDQIVAIAQAADLHPRRRLWSVVDRIAAMHGGWPER